MVCLQIPMQRVQKVTFIHTCPRKWGFCIVWIQLDHIYSRQQCQGQRVKQEFNLKAWETTFRGYHYILGGFSKTLVTGLHLGAAGLPMSLVSTLVFWPWWSSSFVIECDFLHHAIPRRETNPSVYSFFVRTTSVFPWRLFRDIRSRKLL